MEKTIRVDIHGRTYPLRTSEEDEAFARRVAEMVDRRIREIAPQVPGQPDLTLAVLASLQMGEELLLAHQHIEQLQNALAGANELAERLDAALSSPEGNGAAKKSPAPEPRKRAPQGSKNPRRSSSVTRSADADREGEASVSPQETGDSEDSE